MEILQCLSSYASKYSYSIFSSEIIMFLDMIVTLLYMYMPSFIHRST